VPGVWAGKALKHPRILSVTSDEFEDGLYKTLFGAGKDIRNALEDIDANGCSTTIRQAVVLRVLIERSLYV